MGKGRKLAEFRWDVYGSAYKWVSLDELRHIDPHWQTAEESDSLEERFLVVPIAAIRWPATPELTVGGPPSPPWNTPDSAPPANWPTYPKPQPSRRCKPFEVENIFRKFGELQCTEEAILTFARTYGHLGIHVKLGSGGIEDPLGHETFGEPIWEWTKEIRALRGVISLWDRIGTKDRQWLERRIKWNRSEDGTMAVMYDDPEGIEEMVPGRQYRHAVIASRHIRPEGLRVLRSRDVFQAARVLAITDVNERLGQYVFARALLDDSGYDLGLHLVPWNLLGAIWLQLARSLSDVWPYRSCAYCKDWIQVAPQGQSRRQSFCDASCRGKYFRKGCPQRG